MTGCIQVVGSSGLHPVAFQRIAGAAAPRAAVDDDDRDPVVISAVPDLSKNVLAITGRNFGSRGTLDVLMNGATLAAQNVSPTQIAVPLSPSLVAQPGTYLLIVGRGREHSGHDDDFGTLDVTIGAAGPRGLPGPQGIQGATGPTGAVGAQGAKGDTGAPGVKGDTGATGGPGQKGDSGPQGIQGAKGDSGPTGAAGKDGKDGINGKDGAPGSGATVSAVLDNSCLGRGGAKVVDGAGHSAVACDGKNGSNGANGTNGADGTGGRVTVTSTERTPMTSSRRLGVGHWVRRLICRQGITCCSARSTFRSTTLFRGTASVFNAASAADTHTHRE